MPNSLVHLKRMPDLSSYKVGVVLSVEDCGSSKGKSLRACKVNVGDEDNPITVVTAASNVRQGSRQVFVVTKIDNIQSSPSF